MARSQLIDLYSGIQPIGLARLGRPERIEDLMDEEEKDSLLQDLASRGASGLAGLGWLLDTPGSVVRGLLSGGPGKAVSALWEDSDDRVTGRELLRQYGLVGSDDNYANFGTGLAAEIALDPLTYLSFGASALLGGAAKTASGKLAQRAGMFADDLGLLARESGEQIGRNQLLRRSPQSVLDMMPARKREEYLASFRALAGDRADELLEQGMTKSNRFSVPFVGDYAFDMFGERGGEAIARYADRLGDLAQYSPVIGPVVRSAQAMFDPKLLGFTDEEGRWFARELTQATSDSQRSASGRLSQAMVNAARDVGDETFRSEGFANAFRNAMEGQFDQIDESLRPLFQEGGAAANLVQTAKSWQDTALARATQRGIPLKAENLPNGLDYFFRQNVKLDTPRFDPRYAERGRRAYDSSDRVASVVGGSAGRRTYLRPFPAWVINKMARDGQLQATLRDTPNSANQAQEVIDQWLASNAPDFVAPYSDISRKAGGATEFNPESFGAALDEDAAASQSAYRGLANFLREMPLNYAEDGIDYYGNALNDLQRYVRSRGRNEATADVLLRRLNRNVIEQAADEIPGETAYGITDALEKLGFDTSVMKDAAGNDLPSRAAAAMARVMGVTPEELAGRSVDKRLVDQMAERIMKARAPREVGPLMRAADNFTQRFKTLALLFPSRYTRDMYSGSVAAATQNAFNPGDAVRGYRIGGGRYGDIPNAVRHLPDYQALRTPEELNRLRNVQRFENGEIVKPFADLTEDELHDELMIRKFLTDAGGEELTQTSVVDDLGRAADDITLRDAAPGMSGGYMRGLGQQMQRRPVPWDLWETRKRGGFQNWLLSLGDRASTASDNFNRIGTYLNRIRKGDSPRRARQVSDLTQVNYRPEAFTPLERDAIKRLVPFYSYTKGISPLIAQQLLEKPAGLMGASIRSINRAGAPTEDNFTPEYLRRSAAIPLDSSVPGLGLDKPGIRRYLKNIDLPWEGVVNLLSPGVGNNAIETLSDSIQQTGQNLLGQTNPLLKGPLEYLLNRQFYSGRQLSDLYSVLESDLGEIGKPLEQLLINLPGGSRALGVYRQLADDRLSTQDALTKLAFNSLTGMKVTDIDQDRTRRLAARNTLNDLLDRIPEMSSFENLYIKPEELVKLSETEKRQYLLYRILQAEASREARERRKAAEDPLSILGLGQVAGASR